jgi:phospholipid/cholesterol/gamma-HCH transport system substrate-binding protein
MKTAVRKHLVDFAALIGLAVIGIAVAVVILSNQRLHLPSWVPGVGQSVYTVNADFSTAQAVVPGQGQTVDIAGVPIGEIGSVRLKNGLAEVQLNLKPRYGKRVYNDATLLLRPKTGLKDMIAEMSPGTPAAGHLKQGGTIPVSQTAPDVNLDEVLSSLDTDTRAYLEILVNAGGQALSGKNSPADLRQTLKRFEPTNKDLSLINGELSKRRDNVAHVIHNFALLTGAIGQKDKQLAALVNSANANFKALASQDANIRSSLQLLPGTLQTADDTLGKANRFATVLGPTLQRLRPTARALGPTLKAVRPFLADTTPVIKTQLRPFARDVRPTVRQLRVAAHNLAPVTPHLTNTFKVLNSLVNELAYNPPGPEEGYLFWNAWVAHDGATVFGTQDAHGPIRRGLVIASCSSLSLLEQVTATNPSLSVLFQLLNEPLSSQVCPRPPGQAKTQGTPQLKQFKKIASAPSKGGSG